jgi:hypothetical protein
MAFPTKSCIFMELKARDFLFKVQFFCEGCVCRRRKTLKKRETYLEAFFVPVK